MQAAVHIEPKIHKMAARSVMSVMGGNGLHGPELGDIFHALRHAAHNLKEDVEDFVRTDEDKDGRRR